MRFYPELKEFDLSGEVPRPSGVDPDELRHAQEQYREFHRAWQLLFPSTSIENLGALARVDRIGPRIACLCVLSHVIYENELADFFIANVNKRQRSSPTALDKCKEDMVPHFNVPSQVLRNYEAAIGRLSEAKSHLGEAQDPKPPELQRNLEQAERSAEGARRRWMQYAVPRKLHADMRLAEQGRDRVKSTIDAAGANVPVALATALVKANAAHKKAAEAISRAQEDAEEARQSRPKKLETLKKAQAACLPAPARELQPGPSAAAASPSPAP